jgi:hypothetical protein
MTSQAGWAHRLASNVRHLINVHKFQKLFTQMSKECPQDPEKSTQYGDGEHKSFIATTERGTTTWSSARETAGWNTTSIAEQKTSFDGWTPQQIQEHRRELK